MGSTHFTNESYSHFLVGGILLMIRVHFISVGKISGLLNSFETDPVLLFRNIDGLVCLVTVTTNLRNMKKT